MKIVGWQFGSWTFPYWHRCRNNVTADGMWWSEWYVFIGPLQVRIWGKPRR